MVGNERQRGWTAPLGTADGECWHQQKDPIYQAAVIQEEVTDEKMDCEKDLAEAEAAFSEALTKVMTHF